MFVEHSEIYLFYVFYIYLVCETGISFIAILYFQFQYEECFSYVVYINNNKNITKYIRL